MTIDRNPIAALLGIAVPASKIVLAMAGDEFELFPARENICETLYRKNPGFGASNPGFTLIFVPEDSRAMVLGQYLVKKREGVKKAQSLEILARAVAELAQK